ncbi:AsnC family transcriptional regulator [Alteribacter lacisalsi]|uniref:AsnC family transcriptional regulator n=1 Tax=Alteribacter lacisalsi TaxID=2045244 RepID=A0A2W0H5D9_9BACI|nr:Lrp/AsnC family transcriptional regulator [Alteribacter lacisalsi]PYZ97053.1 AsnC family transcriptional regulator [Alteribacter lacisalsi]
MEKEKELLRLLEKNGRMPAEKIGRLLEMDRQAVEEMLADLEKRNVILGYSAVVDWTKADVPEGVTAMIDVKVQPKRGTGFDETAERIYRFKEVKALYLMSGTYDLSVVIEGATMTEVGQFVSEKLSTLDSVLSTTTHFQLKRYKHDGVVFGDKEDDHRMVVSP